MAREFASVFTDAPAAYTVLTGVATNPISAAVDLGQISNPIDIKAFDNDLLIRFSHDDVTYGDDMELPAGAMLSIPLAARYFKVTRAGAADATYEVVGYY